jgi:hypothetical protein
VSKIKQVAVEDLKVMPSLERVVQAFEEFGGKHLKVVVPLREHLAGEFRQGISCEHTWSRIEEEDGLAFVGSKHEETEYGAAEFCPSCGATCLRDDEGKIFAYDATFRYRPDRKKIAGKKVTKH